MTKCLATRTTWTLNKVDLDDTSFITETSKIGENHLNIRLDEIKSITQGIGNDHFKLKNSGRHEGDRWDSFETQDNLSTKCEKLLTEIPSVIEHIRKSDLSSFNKHRYFLHFSSGVIKRLKQLLLMVGRLNDLDQKIYLEEQRKPLMSDQSMVIHTLVEIWCVSIEIMTCFREPAEEIFKEQFKSDEYNFIKESDFYTASQQYSKIFLMDLTITSWLQFNRLVKYDDFLKGLTFLCPCNSKIYLRIFNLIFDNIKEEEFLLQLLSVMSDHQLKPSMLTTETIRDMNVIPMLPCYLDTDVRTMAYFQIWHLFSLSRILKNEEDLKILSNCDTIFLSAFDTAMEQFKPANSSQDFQLSPNQEEKFKLVFAMLDKWCDKYKKSTKIILKMFNFFDSNWSLFGERYFDNNNFRLEGLTVFQLFTKLVYEVIPIRVDQEGHAATGEERNLTSEEKQLDEVWSKLLDRVTASPKADATASKAALPSSS